MAPPSAPSFVNASIQCNYERGSCPTDFNYAGESAATESDWVGVTPNRICPP
jgi:hypothetical protein